ncbi:MAG: hypothetical protein MZV64_11605 [Ignavibacteriales bacterium]|nr:hypothetical protein [Ignavibacteriales bacterium]
MQLRNSFKVYLTLSDKKLYPQPGKIDFIDRAINSQTGTTAMRAVVPNPDGLIKLGPFTTVNLILMERENVVVIPQSAIAQIQGKNHASHPGERQQGHPDPAITLGRNIENMVIVLEGLKPGDKILLEGFQKFKEGMQIKLGRSSRILSSCRMSSNNGLTNEIAIPCFKTL